MCDTDTVTNSSIELYFLCATWRMAEEVFRVVISLSCSLTHLYFSVCEGKHIHFFVEVGLKHFFPFCSCSVMGNENMGG